MAVPIATPVDSNRAALLADARTNCDTPLLLFVPLVPAPTPTPTPATGPGFRLLESELRPKYLLDNAESPPWAALKSAPNGVPGPSDRDTDTSWLPLPLGSEPDVHRLPGALPPLVVETCTKPGLIILLSEGVSVSRLEVGCSNREWLLVDCGEESLMSRAAVSGATLAPVGTAPS